MNRDYIGLEPVSFNCSGQWNCDMQFSGYTDPKSKYPTEINFFDGNMSERKPNNSYMDMSCLDLFDDELNSLYDDYPQSINDEFYNIDELLMWERYMHKQRELNRLNLARQFKQLKQPKQDRTFLNQLILKQQRLKQFLNQEENKWDSRWMNLGNTPTQLFEDDTEKESWDQRSSIEQFSVEQFSEWGSTEKSPAQSDSSKTAHQQEPEQKSRHCRHFLKGHCHRGDRCGFRHDHSVFCSDTQKVFLGRLPAHLTSSLLRQKLEEQGYTVLNHPKILRWFSPQVCLGSVEEAQRLVGKGTIVIDGAIIQVRPFVAFTKDKKKKLPDEVERSVFLGGLAAGTNAEMIKDALGKMAFIVVSIPEVKSGYSRQVVLQTYQQAQTLLNLTQVQINGALVNVRPFANIRSSSGKKKKTTHTRNILHKKVGVYQ